MDWPDYQAYLDKLDEEMLPTLGLLSNNAPPSRSRLQAAMERPLSQITVEKSGIAELYGYDVLTGQPVGMDRETGQYVYMNKPDMLIEQARLRIERKKEIEMDRKQVIDREMERLAAERAELEKFGDDTYQNGTVLKFKYKYGASGRTYTYAALKAGSGWFLTGASSPRERFNWTQLVQFLNRSSEPVKLRVATGFKKVGDGE